MFSLQKFQTHATRLGFAVLVLTLAACSIRPYRIDIQQGNVITAEQFAQLKVGMTRDQVRFVLGSPMLTDIFHDKRWDYHYRMDKGATRELTAYGLSLFFGADGKVEKIVADDALQAQKAEEGNGNKIYDLSAPVSK